MRAHDEGRRAVRRVKDLHDQRDRGGGRKDQVPRGGRLGEADIPPGKQRAQQRMRCGSQAGPSGSLRCGSGHAGHRSLEYSLMQDFSRYSARVVNRPQTMQRPQGRSARIRQQVHWAVIDLLLDRSADELSIPLVADRSGVHQATIYRRWGSIPVLLSDVAAAGPARTSPLPDTGTLRGDLDVYATGVADALAGPLGVLMLRAAVSN